VSLCRDVDRGNCSGCIKSALQIKEVISWRTHEFCAGHLTWFASILQQQEQHAIKIELLICYVRRSGVFATIRIARNAVNGLLQQLGQPPIP